jgi:enterochelin esterase-like enzyme
MPHDVPPAALPAGVRAALAHRAGLHHQPVLRGGARAVHGVGGLPASISAALRRPGPLESRWLAASVVGLGILLAVGWVVAAVRWRRQGRTPAHQTARRVSLSLTTGLLLLLGAGLAVNSVVGYLPTAGSVGELLLGRQPGHDLTPVGARGFRTVGQSSAGSQVARLTIGAPSLDVPSLTTYVYLPPGYDAPANASTRYPAVYLIHGFPGTSLDWLRAGRAEQAADLLLDRHVTRSMIIVFPAANVHWLRDTECLNGVHGEQLETYLTETVVRTIDRDFRTIPDRRGRAIGGMSSGGFCALNLGLRHQDVYSAILASEPYGDPGRGVLRSILGGSQRLYQQNSPIDYVPTMHFTHPMAALLDAGTDDPVTSRIAARLAQMLANRGQYTALRLAPGLHHSWREARAELPYCLVFASQHLA